MSCRHASWTTCTHLHPYLRMPPVYAAAGRGQGVRRDARGHQGETQLAAHRVWPFPSGDDERPDSDVRRRSRGSQVEPLPLASPSLVVTQQEILYQQVKLRALTRRHLEPRDAIVERLRAPVPSPPCRVSCSARSDAPYHRCVAGRCRSSARFGAWGGERAARA